MSCGFSVIELRRQRYFVVATSVALFVASLADPDGLEGVNLPDSMGASRTNGKDAEAHFTWGIYSV